MSTQSCFILGLKSANLLIAISCMLRNLYSSEENVGSTDANARRFFLGENPTDSCVGPVGRKACQAIFEIKILRRQERVSNLKFKPLRGDCSAPPRCIDETQRHSASQVSPSIPNGRLEKPLLAVVLSHSCFWN